MNNLKGNRHPRDSSEQRGVREDPVVKNVVVKQELDPRLRGDDECKINE